ncbi:HET-domain-containing protein [Didymella exigua CBS 183.55]|uniref:HET-domain-containing protein n=1 Tax=Didymella exigua CBS 183.55 TaxID=1150837 RepID=A0A6A5RTN4_9PLEO|nr:HET-domain-containing protein [Didymella exigua CBS 183.55]KAF1930730.1 HET-domain-containing protein [Didymella exigua CBS 183.55]
MRLLETTDGRTYNLTDDFINKGQYPPYAILSHTWVDDQEVTFDHIIEDKRSRYRQLRTGLRLPPRLGKSGYAKLRFCARQARRDGLRYFWVDTCCIDKKDPEELDRAINSMFQWYERATKCYVYLSDVSSAQQNGDSESPTWRSAFERSRWFTRGWTLQELLAPTVVEFFSKEGHFLGDRLNLRHMIHEITDIPHKALSGAPLEEFGVDERLSWAVERQTTREEDEVYALLGLFNVKLPFIYTEGYDSALRRLLDEIESSNAASAGKDGQEEQTLKSTIPFRRDKDFVFRESSHKLPLLFAKTPACVALVGLGGVGKSQLAIEFAYQVLEKSPNTWVFWVHAETETRLRNSYHEIAEMIKMDGRDDPKANITQLVNAWLRNDAKVPWLMIVDSADDASVFFDNVPASDASRESPASPASTTKLPLSSNPPSSHTGSILVTSRSHDVACMLADSEEHIIEVGPMDDHDALDLLRKKFNSTIKSDEATTLVRLLENMPLALTQAAAFINRTPRMSISRYLKAIDNNRAYVLNEGKVDTRRDRGASNSITTTWQISFDYIRSRSPGAARLLSLMSFFDRQEIPRSLLEGHYTAEHHQGQSNFEKDIYMLRSFCLIKSNTDSTTFGMHGLVQYATREWLDRHGELLYWKELIVTLVDKHYPVGHHENSTLCKTLLPHAQAAISNIPQEEDALEAWASLCYKMAWYLGERGNFDKAYELIVDSYDVRRLLWGEDAAFTLDTLNSLALILHRSGRYDEAKEKHQKALQGQIKTLGAESKDALNTKVNLAGLYNDECQWTEAEKLLVEALESCKTALGPHHSLTLNATTLLATTYRDQTRWAEAIELELQMLEIREKQLGPDHPHTLTVKSNLAFTYRQQGRLEEAERLQLQLLNSYSSNPGLELELLTIKGHLARTYIDQGRLSEAEALQLHVFQATKSQLGPSHFTTLTRMSHLSSTYWALARYDDALDLESQTLAFRESKLGLDHLSTLDSKAILAMTYRSLGRLDRAEALGLEVLEAHERKLGARHPLTLESRAGVACTLGRQGRFGEAVDMEEDVVSGRGAILGLEHLETLAGMRNLAGAYKWQGRTGDAVELIEKCCEAYARVVGVQHESTVECRETLDRWRAEA